MSGRCRFDYSEHYAEYGCNAGGNYPCTCGTCEYGEEWDGIEIISCT